MIQRFFPPPKAFKTYLVPRHLCFSLHDLQDATGASKSWDAIRYEVENRIPFDAENLVVTSVFHRWKNAQSLVLAVPMTIASEIANLESQGAWIACVAPEVLLATQQLLAELPELSTGLIFWVHDDSVDQVKIDARVPTQWFWLSMDEFQELIPTLDSNALIIDSRSQGARESLMDESIPSSIAKRTDSMGDFNKRAISAIHAGELSPWFDFRRCGIETQSKSYPIAANGMALLVASILAMLTISITLLWKGLDAHSDSNSLRIAQEDAFKAQFPKQSTPGDIAGRLRSELRNAQLSQQQWSEVPRTPSALPGLLRCLSSFPEDAIFRIDSLRSDTDKSVSVSGACRTLSDLEALTQAFRKAQFQFNPPSMKQMADGYSFRFDRLAIPEPSRVTQAKERQR
jgi:hypothetical protein